MLGLFKPGHGAKSNAGIHSYIVPQRFGKNALFFIPHTFKHIVYF